MTTNHDIDFPTSSTVGNHYDDNYPDIAAEFPVSVIKRVGVMRSWADGPSSCVFEFTVDYEGEAYDKKKALAMARERIEGAFLSGGEWIVAFNPFRRKSQPYSRFFVRVEFWKEDGK